MDGGLSALKDRSIEYRSLKADVHFDNENSIGLEENGTKTHKDIARALRTTARSVLFLANERRIDPVAEEVDGDNIIYLFPEDSTEVFRDEQEWQREYKQLDSYISADQIGEFLGVSRGWVVKTLDELSFTPKQKRVRGNPANLYTRKSVKAIREIILATPQDDGWLTLTALASTTGRHKEWIQRRLKRNGVPGEERRSSLTGMIRLHYPPESIELIERLVDEIPEPAGAWLSAHAIKRALDNQRSQDWIEARLARPENSSLGQLRLDDDRREAVHYPTEVKERLAKEIKHENNLKPKGFYYTRQEIAELAHRDKGWAQRRLDDMGAESRSRMNDSGRVVQCYSPRVMKKLRRRSLKFECRSTSGDYLSTSEVTEAVGHSWTWVKRRLGFVGLNYEKRLSDKNGKLGNFFPPFTIEKLGKLDPDLKKVEATYHFTNLIGRIALQKANSEMIDAN